MDSSLDGVVGKGGGICAKNGPLSADARGESRERRAKCKGPEAGTSWASSRNRKEARAAGAECLRQGSGISGSTRQLL